MATIHRELPLGLKLREALAWIGAVAMSDGRLDVAEKCRALIGDVGDTEIDAQVPLLHILCQACGFLRDSGEHDAAARVDEIVQMLKRDVGQRVIVGTIDFHGSTPHDVERAFEAASKLVAVRR